MQRNCASIPIREISCCLESDLPRDGAYVIPLHERHVIDNDLVVYLLGDEAGEKRIQQTGRVVGWRVHFVRGSRAALPEDITQTVTQYASVQGAQHNLQTYRFSTLYPDKGWQVLEPSPDLGDAALVETRSQVLANGSRLVTYSLSFTYRNMEVRIAAVGDAEQTRLEDVTALAKIVLARLGAVELHSGPVPTPTPGFEPPEADRLIYR